MGWNNSILIKIIIVLYCCQLWLPIKSNGDSYYYYYEDEPNKGNGKKDDLNNADPRRELQFRRDDNKEGENKQGENKEGENKEGENKQGKNKEGKNKEGENKERENKEGENKQGENKEGENKEGDNKQGENKEGDNKEGEPKQRENKEGENKEGENKEGENKERENKEGENKQGENKEGENKEGDNKQGENKEEDNKEGEPKQGENKEGDSKKGDNNEVKKKEKTTADYEAEMDEAMKNMTMYKKDTYDPTSQYWENVYQWFVFLGEGLDGGYLNIGKADDITRACYYIGTSYKNAITDIRHYFRMRYLYANNLHYEVGFLTHEIVFKYQIMLEMFHIVQGRFNHNRTRFYAPTTYMLYMYSNILDMSKQIIHLCNMLHELEKKYAKHPKTVFQDYHLLKKDKTKVIHHDNQARMKMIKQARIDQYKSRMKALKQQRNKMVLSGKLTTPTRTRHRTRNKR